MALSKESVMVCVILKKSQLKRVKALAKKAHQGNVSAYIRAQIEAAGA